MHKKKYSCFHCVQILVFIGCIGNFVGCYTLTQIGSVWCDLFRQTVIPVALKLLLVDFCLYLMKSAVIFLKGMLLFTGHDKWMFTSSHFSPLYLRSRNRSNGLEMKCLIET